MKRILAILLALLLLTGCQPNSVDPGTSDSGASSVMGSSAPSTGVPQPSTDASTAPSVPATTIPTDPPTSTGSAEPALPEPSVPDTPEVPDTPDTPNTPAVPSCSGHDSDPYVNVNTDAFYDHYTTACCYTDAQYRSEHYLMSGELEVPGQYATIASDRPTESGLFVRNTYSYYLDNGNTYAVVDQNGNIVLCVHRGGAYITLEEVAAYMYAFGGSDGSFPANYVSGNKVKPTQSNWGIYLRLNHTRFSGNTKKYPYEPVLPNISGCGGDLQYYEMDIGTTGTVTDPSYPVKLYNNGTTITRGAARIVYARQDLNGDGVYTENEIYVFYTANHYNDFREYLNYYNGWGKEFGNITGGGSLSSKTDYKPTPYVLTAYRSFYSLDLAA